MKRKIVKTYEAFVGGDINTHFKFEENVIDPVLSCIRDNQEYLTEPENLPQLAKLGYIYNTLWYDGRLCWGSEGLLRKGAKTTDEDGEESDYYDCEDNPKYKIEMCNPHNEEIEDLIYDAWGMHIMESEGKPHMTTDEFFDIVYKGKPLTELEKKMLKINKTFDEWVEIKTDKDYRYKSLYPNRKAVASHLLCTIGNGYGWNKDGFIIEEAGGADQDKSIYGDWQNAKFSPEIKKVVDKVLSYPEVRKTVETAYNYIEGKRKERQKEEDNRNKRFKEMISKHKGIDVDDISDDEMDEIMDQIIRDLHSKRTGKSVEKPEVPYSQYYPISASSDIYAILSDEKRIRLGIEKFDQSYIDAAIEICKDIIEHESQERKENVEFAKKLLTKYNVQKFDLPKEVDKYSLLKDIEESFFHITDSLSKSQRPGNEKSGEYSLYLNDTKDSDYADNNYYFIMSLEGQNLPFGYSNDVEYIKGNKLYSDVKSTLNRLSHTKEIKFVSLHVDNGKVPGLKPSLSINMYVNGSKYQKEKKKSEDDLVNKGFGVGSRMIMLETKDYIIVTTKPEPLGSSHPNNRPGYEYFNVNKPVTFYNKSWNKMFEFMLDERGFNILNYGNGRMNNKVNQIMEEFNKMKNSDPDYGLYGIKGRESKYEGKNPLYAHDFMLWLKNNGF